jgi:hypothetical protein
VAAPFVVLYYGNTGSSWLIETLGHAPGVLVPAFEPLEAWAWKAPDREKVAWMRNAFSIPVERSGPSFDRWIEGLEASPQFKGLTSTDFTTIAFKMTNSALRSDAAMVDVFEEFGTRLVFLRRENRIKHALSLYRYHEEKKSQFDHAGIRPPSDVDLKLFKKWLSESEKLDSSFAAFQDACERRLGAGILIDVAYEEFVSEDGKQQTIERLARFLELPGGGYEPGGFKKATSDDLKSAVVNYRALRRKFGRGDMAKFFGES